MVEKLGQVISMLLAVMIIASVFKEAGVMSGVYAYIKPHVKSKRTLIAIMSLIFGVLPIPGRIIFACGVLDSVQNRTHNNQKMGVIAYLASHHYYLWSPLEKAVIIVYSALGIGYLGFMQYMWIPAVIAIVFSFAYIYSSVSEDEIFIVDTPKTKAEGLFALLMLLAAIATSMFSVGYTPLILLAYACTMALVYNVHPDKWDVDLSVLGLAAAAVVAGHAAGLLSSDLMAMVTSFKGTLIMALAASFIASFILGSSAKYGALCAVMVKVFGLAYLPLFYLVDYAAYLISPTHSCMPIAKQYFKTPVGMFMLPLLVLSLILILYASVSLLF